MTDWAPATEAEAAMRDALRADDQELYFRILARVELLLPISSDAIAGRVPMGWGTWTVGDRTHVLAFTSPEAMHACLAEHAGSARKIPYYELAAAWPNLEWWLAVNPGLPIEGYLPAWFVSQLARGDVRMPGRPSGTGASKARAETLGRARVPGQISAGLVLAAEPAAAGPTAAGPTEVAPPPEPEEAPESPERATGSPDATVPAATAPPEPAAPEQPGPAATPPADFQPANDLEAQLADAVRSGSTDTFLSKLLLSKVLLPVAEGADPSVRPGDAGYVWRTEKVDDHQSVAVYTSPERLRDHVSDLLEAVDIRFVQLIRAWPDESWSLAVNPGTQVGATLPGTQITGLASSAAEFGLDDDAGVAGESAAASSAGQPAADQPVSMQKAIAPAQVGWYLERGYDRVSGFVHRSQEVIHLRTPASLVAALGLRFDGSPFDAEPEEIYVIRWLAYCPQLYRIPYGGRTEAAMTAMQGWVIERTPFRGNGFAPADSGDVIAEFKVDSARLPHGAELWRYRADGSSQLVAMLDADGPSWRQAQIGES